MNYPIIRLTPALVLALFAISAAAQESGMSPEAQALWDSELAFAASVADKDYEKFLSLIDENAIFASGAPLRGRAAIAEGWKAFFAEDGPTLVWEPTSAEVRPGGDIGVTHGPYLTTSKNEDGTTSRGQGMFFSVWERQDDGSWKIIFDSGTPSTPLKPKKP